MQRDETTDNARQYDPTAGVDDWRERLAAWQAAADEARASLTHRADIRYGTGPRQCLDIFPAGASDQDESSGAVIFIHGGFWRALSKNLVAGVASALVPRGIASIHLGYDLCPKVSLPRIADEIDEALDWCGANLPNYGIDPRRLAIAGSSAGAHLAAMAIAGGSSGERPAFLGAFLSSGLYDLAPLVDLPINRDLGLDEATARAMSPLHAPPPAGMPVALQVGGAESDAWRAQTYRYRDACESAGAAVAFTEFPGAHHFAIGLGVPGSAASNLLAETAAGWIAAAPADTPSHPGKSQL